MHRSFGKAGNLRSTRAQTIGKPSCALANQNDQLLLKKILKPTPPPTKTTGQRKKEEYERHKLGFGATSTRDYFIAEGGYDPVGGTQRQYHVYEPKTASKLPSLASVPNPLTLGFQPDNSKRGIRIRASRATYNPVLQTYKDTAKGVSGVDGRPESARTRRERRERTMDYLPSGRILSPRKETADMAHRSMAKEALQGTLEMDPSSIPSQRQRDMMKKRNKVSEEVEFAMNADAPTYAKRNEEYLEQLTSRREREKWNPLTQQVYSETEKLHILEQEAAERRERIKEARAKQLEMESAYDIITITDKMTGKSVDGVADAAGREKQKA